MQIEYCCLPRVCHFSIDGWNLRPSLGFEFGRTESSIKRSSEDLDNPKGFDKKHLDTIALNSEKIVRPEARGTVNFKFFCWIYDFFGFSRVGWSARGLDGKFSISSAATFQALRTGLYSPMRLESICGFKFFTAFLDHLCTPKLKACLTMGAGSVDYIEHDLSIALCHVSANRTLQLYIDLWRLTSCPSMKVCSSWFLGEESNLQDPPIIGLLLPIFSIFTRHAIWKLHFLTKLSTLQLLSPNCQERHYCKWQTSCNRKLRFWQQDCAPFPNGSKCGVHACRPWTRDYLGKSGIKDPAARNSSGNVHEMGPAQCLHYSQ